MIKEYCEGKFYALFGPKVRNGEPQFQYLYFTKPNPTLYSISTDILIKIDGYFDYNFAYLSLADKEDKDKIERVKEEVAILGFKNFLDGTFSKDELDYLLKFVQ